MNTRTTSRPASGEERRSAANAEPGAQLKPATAATMPDARASSLAQLQHQERASSSRQAAQLKARADMMAGRGADAPVQRASNAAAGALPVQRAVKEAAVEWGVTHIVELKHESLFGEGDALMNEVSPGNGGQLKEGDKLVIDDAPVVVSRRGSNQEDRDKRARDATGDKVYEWVRVLKIIPLEGEVRDFTAGSTTYVRKETIAIAQGAREQAPEARNKISLRNIGDWAEEEIPQKLTGIAEKWRRQGALKRTKSSGVLSIDRRDMAPISEGGRAKPSGRNWDQYDEGIQVASNMADEEHGAFDAKGQWRIKAVDGETGELVGVLIVEDQDPLYLRWLIGNPEIKGGGSALLAAVKKLLLDESTADSVEVTSAYSAKSSYTKAGFKESEEGGPPVRPGEEFTLSLSLDDEIARVIPEEYAGFVPEKYKFDAELAPSVESGDVSQ